MPSEERYNEVVDYYAKGGIPFPSQPIPEEIQPYLQIPIDLGDILPKTLGSFLSVWAKQLHWVQFACSKSEVELTYYVNKLDLLKKQLFMSLEDSQFKNMTEKKNAIEVMEEVILLKAIVEEKSMNFSILETSLKMSERNYALLSREITRRGLEPSRGVLK